MYTAGNSCEEMYGVAGDGDAGKGDAKKGAHFFSDKSSELQAKAATLRKAGRGEKVGLEECAIT